MYDKVVLQLSIGERITLLHMLNTFQGDRTASVMRKTKRIKHGVGYKSVINASPLEALESDERRECEIDKEALTWLWDNVWQKYDTWPTILDEWIDSLEDSIRAALLEASKEKPEQEKAQ